jgi:hypothetical protein
MAPPTLHPLHSTILAPHISPFMDIRSSFVPRLFLLKNPPEYRAHPSSLHNPRSSLLPSHSSLITPQ